MKYFSNEIILCQIKRHNLKSTMQNRQIGTRLVKTIKEDGRSISALKKLVIQASSPKIHLVANYFLENNLREAVLYQNNKFLTKYLKIIFGFVGSL